MTQAVIMLLFGGAIVKATLTDVYLRYVKEGLRPFLLLAGILLVAAAVMTIWYDLRPTRHAEPEDGHGHGHGHHEPRVGWLLLLPVLGLLLISPPALGSYAANQSGSVGPAAASDYPPLPDGDPVEVSLLDYASRAVFDSGRSLAGRTVRLTGFITAGADGRPMLARMVLTCCAADGRPIKIGLAGAPIDAPADAWVELVGVYTSQVGTDPVNRAPIAYLDVRSWQEVDQPKQPYA
ncbi:TIGR03943 family putative permease subunit [Actinoplanes teichomyceticus]|uniref:Putative repeat protein (TIGR03943 family) n=1 Tax=Actinoplanes teichomyceticus TaxID=1867 RepID=A0A561VCG6_ACTTI|nr:putative repeat protein (TIGR03943 family) [Actinoplanes teichomyceticus]GIF16685.1 membrane protein [Actinoplanes teichomyceticus]